MTPAQGHELGTRREGSREDPHQPEGSHALTVGAGWLAAHGLLDPSKQETWVAAALLLLGWGWGLIEKAAREA